MNPETTRRAREGFTLTETLIAITMLAFGLGAAALTFNMSMRSVATSQTQMAAMHFARQQVEELRRVDWEDAALTADVHALGNGDFDGTYLVTDVDDRLKDVTVRVQWPDEMAGGIATLTLATTFAKPLHD